MDRLPQSIISAAPHLRLVLVSALSQKELEEEVLLDTGLLMFPPPRSDDTLDFTGRVITCTSTFFAINWLKELLNFFCNHRDAKVTGKCLERVKQLVQLEAAFVGCVSDTAIFDPCNPIPKLSQNGDNSTTYVTVQGLEEPSTSRSLNRSLRLGKATKAQTDTRMFQRSCARELKPHVFELLSTQQAVNVLDVLVIISSWSAAIC
jgi:hypothetical protein